MIKPQRVYLKSVEPNVEEKKLELLTSRSLEEIVNDLRRILNN